MTTKEVITFKLESQKNRKITKKQLDFIANKLGAKKAKLHDIYCFNELEYILFLDNVRSGRISFIKELENIGEYRYIPIIHIASFL
jgi:hypothetical protein